MIQNGRAIHEEGRLPMDWQESRQDLDLYAYFAGLAQLRRETPCLRDGKRQPVYADDAILAYRRFDADSALVTVLNVSPNPVTLTLTLPEASLRYATGPDCRLDSAPEGVTIDLPPYGGMVIT